MRAESIINNNELNGRSIIQYPILMQHNGCVKGEGNPDFRGVVYLFTSEYVGAVIGLPIAIQRSLPEIGDIVRYTRPVQNIPFFSPFEGQVILKNV